MLASLATQHAVMPNAIEVALESLRQERVACVEQLGVILATNASDAEIESYLRRIEDINAALVRLAGAHVVH